jgi:hypothetical protein
VYPAPPPPPSTTMIPNCNMAAFHNFQSQGGVTSPSQQMPSQAAAQYGLNMAGMTNLVDTTTTTNASAMTQQMAQTPAMAPPPDMASIGVLGDYWCRQKFQSAPHFP